MPPKKLTGSKRSHSVDKSSKAQKVESQPAAAATKSNKAAADSGAPRRDTDLPIDASGVIYHLGCASADLADCILLVGDPGRVPLVAEHFDKGSVTFKGVHREIAIITGTFKGTRVSALSTGMGTDNCEIVLNEVHALKELNHATGKWLGPKEKKPNVRIIRVGTCGSPNPKCTVGTLAVTQHSIGLDNTCRYYKDSNQLPSVKALAHAVNTTTPLGKETGGVYAAKAHPDVTSAIVKQAAKVCPKRNVQVGITCSCSGFYGCQGRCIGRFKGHVALPNLIDILASVRVPATNKKASKKGGKDDDDDLERVANIEMETSCITFLCGILGYRAGAVCAVIAARDQDKRSFATPEEGKAAVTDGILVALNALVSM